MNPEIVSFQYATGMCLLLENVGGCVHAGRPEVVTLNICYNLPVLFRAIHILQENGWSKGCAVYYVWQHQCCGIDSYKDFSVATDWTKTYTVTRGDVTKNIELKIPMACCKTGQSTVGASSSEDGGAVLDKFCAEEPTDANSNWNTVIF